MVKNLSRGLVIDDHSIEIMKEKDLYKDSCQIFNYST